MLKKAGCSKGLLQLDITALVDFTKVTPVPDNISDACEWFAISEIPGINTGSQKDS